MTPSGACAQTASDPQAQLLQKGRLDFGGAFIVASRMVRGFAEQPARVERSALDRLDRTLGVASYRRQKQAYFFYREVAGGLAAVAAVHPDPAVGGHALHLLERRLGNGHYGLHRAVAEALGGLPLEIVPLGFADRELPTLRTAMPFPELNRAWLRRQGFDNLAAGRWIGRSLVLDGGSRGLVVVKCLRAGEASKGLVREAFWMERLSAMRAAFAEPFAIPAPLTPSSGGLMRLATDLPFRNQPPPGLDPRRVALVYTATADYFRYPNSPAGPLRLTGEQVCETLGRCACLLGQALAHDLVHTAPIPLFHNRTQQDRRADGGRYEWPRAGRLDRWLASCRYPNIAQSGLRDFEHFRLLRDTAFTRFEWIGVHLISLFLVAGSYFRTAAPRRVGLDAAGRPVDARDLFAPPLLADMIRSICEGYRRGFVGLGAKAPLPFDLDTVVARMIEEMGVDRHMEEVLRTVDQDGMSREALASFLMARGFSRAQAAAVRRGQADIVLQSGPHLGGFNQSISLPELIHMTGAVAADCVARRFRRERGWAPPA